MAVMSKKEWLRRRRRKKKIRKYTILGGMAVAFILVLLLVIKLFTWIFSGSDDGIVKKVDDVKVTQKLLTKDDSTRPGTPLTSVKTVVIHDDPTPDMTAMQRRDYYESRRDAHNDKDSLESMHFIVGQDGSIVQCIPINEAAYASKSRNADGISVEFCGTNADGTISAKAYESLVKLVGYLCDEFDIKASSLQRHFDVTGKNCPQYFSMHEDAWTQFRADVSKAADGKDFSTDNPIVKKSS